MEIIDKITEFHISNNEETNEERENLIDTQLKGKSSEEIATYLTSIPPSEMGGITALSGFYYQFLVTIEYIIEMLEGKWDFVIMEGHDDVVVGKDKKIRFVQVKTSQKVKLNVTESPASGLYSRGTKIIDGISYIRNNNWVDKLFSNAEIVPKSLGFRTEFQLYASYHFTKTNNNDFDRYTNNEYYEIDIPKKDNLLEKLNIPIYTLDGKLYKYEERCGESLEELISRFYLKTGISLGDIDMFKNDLRFKLNNYLFKDIGENITMEVKDLHMLIGELFTNCTYKDNPKVLMITKESVEDILSEIREKCIRKASNSTQKHDSKVVINKVIKELVNEFEDFKHAKYLEDRLYTYREYILDWISNGGNIRQLLERYIEGTTRTQIYSSIGEVDKINRVTELYRVVLILFIGRDSLIKFVNNKGLLSKKCEVTNEIFSFISLKKKRKFEVAVEKIESILNSSNIKEQLFLQDKELHVIIQNYTDRNFSSSKEHEFTLRPQIEIPGIQDDFKLNQVPIITNIIPGDKLTEDYLEAADTGENIQDGLQEIWMKYGRGEE